MSGVVDFRTLLEDENGNPINALNPLPTTGGGGGGGALADVLLTDGTGALFVSRDDGTTVTYFNLNTNAVYTPVGTIKAAGLTDAQLRAAPVPVAVNDVTGELIEAIEALRMTVGSLSRTIGLSIPDLLGRQRISVDAMSGGLTLSTVSTLSNQTQIGGFVAADQIPALMHMSADNLRRNITVT
jgi:hypothetical protein